ncbi:glycosyltransferase family 1 protein, partial [Micromonospora sp. NPDC003776]
VHLGRGTPRGLRVRAAFTMGRPVVALATTEAVEAVPPTAGALSTRVDVLLEAARALVDDPSAARRAGAEARAAARNRYGLERFLADWDRLLEEEVCASR